MNNQPTIHRRYLLKPAFLQFRWPDTCPFSPEEVIAACDVKGMALLSLPYRYTDWCATVCDTNGRAARTIVLTSSFIASGKPTTCHDESKKCHCKACNDRRKGDRRAQTAIRTWVDRRRHKEQGGYLGRRHTITAYYFKPHDRRKVVNRRGEEGCQRRQPNSDRRKA